MSGLSGVSALTWAIGSGDYPAGLTLTGWWRAPYSASPWVGTASLGASGSRDLTEATNPPGTSALNGLNGANFDGTNDVLANATAISSYLTASAWSAALLMRVDSGTYPTPGTLDDTIVVGDSAGRWGIGVRNNAGNKVYAYQHDGAIKTVEFASVASAIALYQIKYDGTNLSIKRDSASYASTATGNLSLLTGTLKLGTDHSAAGTFFDGAIWEFMLTQSALSDANFDGIRAYCNQRYGLAL